MSEEKLNEFKKQIKKIEEKVNTIDNKVDLLLVLTKKILEEKGERLVA